MNAHTNISAAAAAGQTESDRSQANCSHVGPHGFYIGDAAEVVHRLDDIANALDDVRNLADALIFLGESQLGLDPKHVAVIASCIERAATAAQSNRDAAGDYFHKVVFPKAERD